MHLRYWFALCLLVLAAGSADARELAYVRQQDTADAVRQAVSQVFGSTFNKSYAVVIGVGNYRKDPRLPSLSAPASDAVRMHNFLKDEAGFDYIVTLTDEHASKSRIEELMDKVLPSMVGPSDRFLFYFSGHGLTRPLADGQKRGYLALADATRDSWNLMIDMPRLRQWTENFFSARHSLFLIDACFSGLAAFEPKSEVERKTLSRLRQPAHHLLTAGTEGEQSFIVNGESLFTQAFLSAARGNSAYSTGDLYVSLSEVLVQINKALDRKRAEVRDEIKMTPRIYYSRIGNNSGEFFFITTSTAMRPTQESDNRTSPSPQATPKGDAPPSAPPVPPASPAPVPLVSPAPTPHVSPSPAPPAQTQQSAALNARYIPEPCGSIKDRQTNLEWYVGPDDNLSWSDASSWVRNLQSCGGNWSLPTSQQVATLFDPAKTAGTGYFTAGKNFPAHIDPIFSKIGAGSWIWLRGGRTGGKSPAYNLNQNLSVQFSSDGSEFPARAFGVREIGTR
ncbi:caspase family protein [Reyranella soli]|uniref:Peptidase C14 caspase domain-containing protein n=1 Tax=Reyranella soli TaxID=1230389 RepID=A0A512NCN9_9HYPH|nr:caspase family protein [Reyranella soli]GEP56713.1 hypothetical protein RSO01_38790 [Reyranella soli]